VFVLSGFGGENNVSRVKRDVGIFVKNTGLDQRP